MSSTFQWNAVSFSFHWIAVGDSHTCSKCAALNGQTIEGNPFSRTLDHPQFGPIWDFELDLPLTHGHSYHNCRCQLEAFATIHWSQIEPIASLCSDFKITIEDDEVKLPDTLDEVRSKLSELRDEIDSLNMGYHELRELETILQRTLRMLRASTGSEDVKQSIIFYQRLITIVRMAQFTIRAFQVATGPIGWAFALSGLAMTGMTALDVGSRDQYYEVLG